MTPSAAWIIDVLLVLLLLASLVWGYRSGLARSAFALAGLVLGSVAAVLAVPVVITWVPALEWRTPAALATVLVLVVGAAALGVQIGERLRRGLRRTPLRFVDRGLGAVGALVVSALAVSMLAAGVGALGVPFLAQPLATSVVLRAIDTTTPPIVDGALARLRASVLTDGLPVIVDAFGGRAPEIPDVATTTPALQASARSVVRVTGTAYACGQNQSGSGVVIAPGRVITNAHVVAGVTEPVVETPLDGARTGRIVYFDPVDDLAVIAVDGLPTAPLPLGADLTSGSPAVVDGYPFGGPFRSHSAEVVDRGARPVADIYGRATAPRDIYTLAADIQQGESGGALLDEAGAVVGIIFAKGATTPDVGYALALSEVAPVISGAPSFDAGVPAGECIPG
ncbi:MAG: hypothetical protein RI885_932 [Actinomycetota bacterium]